jgi:endoglycosylceramidase
MLAAVRPCLRWLLAAFTPLAFPACDSAGTVLPPTCTLTAPTLPDWRLHTDGTRLRDALGRVVLLRGVDAGGRSKLAPYMPFEYASEADFPAALASYMDRAASWGIDSMRVPWTWAALEPTKGTTDHDWMSRYKQLLDAAWARGITTVVDFHQDVYSECFCGDGFPCWTLPAPPSPPMQCPNPDWYQEYEDADVEQAFDAFWAPGSPVQGEYLAAWDTMIAAFADEPGVVGFEPLNEPSSGSANDATFQATTLTDFFTRMIAHFTAKAPGTLVFVDDTGTAGGLVQTTMMRPAGSFVFAPHFYPVLNPADTDEITTRMKVWADLGAQWNVPVWIGEFGVSHTLPDAPGYMAATFASLDALGLGGTEWEYSVETQEWNDETDGLVAGDGTEYPVAQAVIRPYARAVAGSAVSQSYAADSGAFTVTWTPAAGVTEIAVPIRAYPRGTSVTLSQGCYDATSVPGTILVDAQGSTAPITLAIEPRGH